MLKVRVLIVALSAVAAWSAVADAPAERPRGDWIDGQWRAVATIMGGQPNPTLTFRDDRLRFEFATGFGASFFMESRIVAVDASQTPAHLDMVFENTNLPPEFGDAAEQLGESIKAIYAIDGDRITIANSPPGSGERPKSLEADPNGEAMVFVGQRVADAKEGSGGGAKMTMSPNLPAELAGAWRQIQPMVLTVKEGHMELKTHLEAEPFEQYELIALGFDGQGAGRLATVTLDSQNRGIIGRTYVSRVEFDGPDRMVTAFYPPGHPKADTWPESVDLTKIPAGMMVATWERIK